MSALTIDAAVIRRRLWIVLVIYEFLVVTIVAGAGLNIALMSGGSVTMAAPLALIACAEALRVPLSGWSTRLRWSGRALALIALLAISVGSAEGLALVFEQFLNNRVVETSQAARAVAQAQREVDEAGHRDSALVAQVAELDAQAAAPAHSMPSAPASSNRTCTWRGQRVSCSADSSAAAAYSTAMKAYDARLQGLQDARRSLQASIDQARRDTAASEALEAAKASFSEKAGLSPVYRLVAAVYGEDVGSVTDAQFNRVKRFVVGTLAITFATLSMAVSIAVHLTPASERPSKLARAIRAMVAARRKTLRRIRETVRTEVRERVKFIHVPVDVATGKVIDPDGKLGETIGGGRS